MTGVKRGERKQVTSTIVIFYNFCFFLFLLSLYTSKGSHATRLEKRREKKSNEKGRKEKRKKEKEKKEKSKYHIPKFSSIK